VSCHGAARPRAPRVLSPPLLPRRTEQDAAPPWVRPALWGRDRPLATIGSSLRCGRRGGRRGNAGKRARDRDKWPFISWCGYSRITSHSPCASRYRLRPHGEKPHPLATVGRARHRWCSASPRRSRIGQRPGRYLLGSADRMADVRYRPILGPRPAVRRRRRTPTVALALSPIVSVTRHDARLIRVAGSGRRLVRGRQSGGSSHHSVPHPLISPLRVGDRVEDLVVDLHPSGRSGT
jgi:hypothetical protein